MLSSAAVVVCALSLLGRSHTAVPVHFIESPPPGASRNAEAFIAGNPPAIFLVTSTAAFQEAQYGDHGGNGRNEGCQKIASIIVHEEWHLEHGSDEEGAYLAQLTTLAALGASSPVMTAVRLSMMVVTKRQHERRPEVVVAQGR
jgi:hypothetical protein